MTKPKRGRPSAYKPEFATIAKMLCGRGATVFELSQEFDVDRATVFRWIAKHQEFCDAVQDGREHADNRVQRSLYERAVGYSYQSEKLFAYEGEVIRANTIEHVPPDVKAAMHWLHNRKSKEWKEHDFEVKGEDGNVFRVHIMA